MAGFRKVSFLVAAAAVTLQVFADKAGLPLTTGSIDINQFLTTGNVAWYHTFSPSAISSTSLEFVPMLASEQQASEWATSINATIQQLGVTHVMAFDEPDAAGSTSLSPATAAALWLAYIQPLQAQGVLLGSPATISSSSPVGMQWLEEFFDTCGGCSVDFIPVHYYGTDSVAFIETVEEYHNTFQKPLWVIAWSCEDFNTGATCALSEVMSFLNATQAYMDSADYVERYAWDGMFIDPTGTDTNTLINSAGAINALGEQYIDDQRF